MARFITGEELTEEVYEIIHKAKKELLIVSPYIILDDYFKKEVFVNQIGNDELHVMIAFGKNEKDPHRSFKKEDFEYFKAFRNISIVYVPNLHAKYYGNESKGLVSSINLYDYSFKNNIEFGVLSEISLLGSNKLDGEAWEVCQEILENNCAVFIKRPVYKKKMLLGKDYKDSKVLLDLTDDLLHGKKLKQISYLDFDEELIWGSSELTQRKSREEFESKNSTIKASLSNTNEKLLSATNLGKIKNKSFNEVIDILVVKECLFDKHTITKKGMQMGITFKENANGNKWIVYPESLAELL
jgi:hypothetical protein